MSQNISKLTKTLRPTEIKTGESIPQFYFPQGKNLDSVNEASIRVQIVSWLRVR